MPIELVNQNNEPPETSGLRLVDEAKLPNGIPAIEKQFVNFIFFKADPAWRRLPAAEKAEMKREFESVVNVARQDMLLFSYSLVGFDSKADLMLWRISPSMDAIQDTTAGFLRTALGGYLETADNYLAATKRMMFVTDSREDRMYVNAGEKKYHFLYACMKNEDWYAMSAEEQDALIEENFMVGRRFPNIKIHMTHALGFSEQDYLISFETDEPKDFLALAEELRRTPASRFSIKGMPVYTCRQRTIAECLDALG